MFTEIHPGQIWSVPDKHRGGLRRVRVVATDPDVNDDLTYGPKVEMVNTETGRHTTPQAHTVRTVFTLEREAT